MLQSLQGTLTIAVAALGSGLAFGDCVLSLTLLLVSLFFGLMIADCGTSNIFLRSMVDG